jgi:predicted lipoprotein with Yx(FWY)xxD motif
MVRGRGIAGFALAIAMLLGGLALLGTDEVRAQAGATVQSGDTDDLGEVLTGPEGMTLYIFTRDTTGVSNCSGGCLAAWPPLTVDAGATPTAASGLSLTLGTITRTDTGATQVTLDGMPLYYWASDEAPGDTTGHGVNGVWFALNTDGEALAVATTPTATATATATGTVTATATSAAPQAPAAGSGTALPAGGIEPLALFLIAGGIVIMGAVTLSYARRR